MTVAIIIPARYESTRFPGKPLTLINGKPMIEWVVSSAKKSRLANKIIVATEDERILDFVKNNLKVESYITSKEHKSGTDRICEIVKNQKDIKFVVNLQGDEPLLPPEYIDKVISPLLNSSIQMSTLASKIKNKDEITNPNIVKVVFDKDGYALYFSRSQIPYDRNNPLAPNIDLYFRHLGIYGYTRESIIGFSSMPTSKLELAEQLEQLRMLENGIRIKVDVVPRAFPAVDVPEDITVVEKELSQAKA